MDHDYSSFKYMRAESLEKKLKLRAQLIRREHDSEEDRARILDLHMQIVKLVTHVETFAPHLGYYMGSSKHSSLAYWQHIIHALDGEIHVPLINQLYDEARVALRNKAESRICASVTKRLLET